MGKEAFCLLISACFQQIGRAKAVLHSSPKMNLLILKPMFSKGSSNPDQTKAAVYPGKESIHRAVMWVVAVRCVEANGTLVPEFGKKFYGTPGNCVCLVPFIKRANLLRTFKVESHDGPVDRKTEQRGEAYAVCGWHQVCAAWLRTSSSGSEEHEGTCGRTHKPIFSKQQESHADVGFPAQAHHSPLTVPGTIPRRQNLLILFLNNFIQIVVKLLA